MSTDKLGRDLAVLEKFREIEDAITEADDFDALLGVDDTVIAFRDKYPEARWMAERAWLALHLARAYHGADEVEEAQIWALRSLVDGPRADTLCLLGEIAAKALDFRAAVSWYEAALGMSETPPYRGENSLLPPYEIPGVLERARARLEELRRQVYPERERVRVRVEPASRHMIAVMTAPRPVPTLPAMLQSMRRAGLTPELERSSLLMMDTCIGLVSEFALSWQGKYHLRGFGSSARSFLEILRLAVEADVDRLTVFEDDVIFARDSISYILGAELPEAAVFATWFAMHMPLPERCWVFRPVPEFAMSQALTLPRATVEHILKSEIARNWKKRHVRDALIAQAAPDGVFAIHQPSIVQHVGGLNSAMENEWRGPRMSPSFIGEHRSAFDVT